jgi:DNA-directed RNA polymerase specialized sigma24 family protein
MTTPKWTEERTAQLIDSVGDESPVSRGTVADLADELATSTRSISSKLRKLGYDVELASATPRAFSDEATEALRDFVNQNSGAYTYAEIAENFPGDYTAKAIQGKILSMELTAHVKETPKQEAAKTYTPDEEALVLKLIAGGKFVEEIAEAVGKSVQSVRGKALSLQRAGQIEAMPKQRDVKGPAADPLDAIGDVSKLSVADIAEQIGKTERGVKTMLTRRGLKASDYDGAAKKEKAAA